MSKPTKALIFNKFRIKKLIASSHFGLLYEGINIKNNELVAMKFQKKTANFNLLESEAYFLFLLKGFGIPKLISYGKTGTYYILIEEFLGLSIQEIYNNKKFKLKDICIIALQCIDRLEYIHSKNIIHRDIKPNNITIGRKDPNILYLIDFGFAHKFRSSRTGKHIKFNNLKKALGSIRFMSINANKGFEQSRRDDLESLGYMLIYLAKNNLPWIELEQKKIQKIKRYQLVCSMKIKNTSQMLCSGLPSEFCKYLNYAKALEFEQNPDYNYLRKLFLDILEKDNFKNDFRFSWAKIQKNKKSIDYSDVKSFDNTIKTGRDNSKKRLYNKIKKSLELEKSRSQDEPSLSKILNKNNNDDKRNNNKRNKTNIIPMDKNLKLNSSEPKNRKKKELIYSRKKIQGIKFIKRIKIEKFVFDNDENYVLNSNRDNKDNLRNNEFSFRNEKSQNKTNDNNINIYEIKKIQKSSFLKNDKMIKNSSKTIIKNDIESNVNKIILNGVNNNSNLKNRYKTLKEREKEKNFSQNNLNNIFQLKKKLIYKNMQNNEKTIINLKNRNETNLFDECTNNNFGRFHSENSRNQYRNNNYSIKRGIKDSFLDTNSNSFLFNRKNKLSFIENSNNEYKSPHNYNLKNFSSNYNMDEDTFKSYGLENTKESQKRNNINLNLNHLKYKPNIKINKNYNINIINQKNNQKGYLSNKLFRYDKFNNNYYSYIPLSQNKEKDIFY